MFSPFIQFGFIILVVCGVSIIIKLLKQPLIIGYIISGILVGPVFLDLIKGSVTLNIFAEMGISFLLFIVGLHLSPKVIKEFGKISLITGMGQILFTSIIGYLIAISFGFSIIISIYIAIALTFSSTIIVLKLLSDKDSLEKLYGKISIGFLLVQDLVAILIIIIVSSLAGGASAGNLLFSTLIKGILILAFLIPISYYILPKLSNFIAKSQEFLFIFAVSWGLGLSLIFYYIGFSIEVGALIAGIMLSISPYSFEISSKLKPLRDFFIISFFIILGSQMAFGDITHLIFPAIVFSIFVLVGHPLIIMILMGLLGYSKKTSFMAGLTVAQISEFSLILIALGVKVGDLPQEILSFVTIIGLLTIAGSTYLFIYSDSIFKKIEKFLTIFEKKKIKERAIIKSDYDYILFGYNRIGFSILRTFSKISKNFLVVDYNPQIVSDLVKDGIPAIYGDADDAELLEDLGLHKASLVVSTIPEKESNKLIMEVLKRNKANTVVILTSRQIEDALELYKEGANYVILPHFLGGEYAAKLIETSKFDRKEYEREKRKELKILKERLKHGHQHPMTEKNTIIK